MSAAAVCPACKKSLPIKGIPKHVSGCSQWSLVIGTPPSEFNWDAHCKRGPYADGLMEGTNYVRCLECAKKGWDARFKRMMDHLKKVHGYGEATYLAKYPNAAVRIASTAQKREGTVHHYVTFVGEERPQGGVPSHRRADQHSGVSTALTPRRE